MGTSEAAKVQPKTEQPAAFVRALASALGLKDDTSEFDILAAVTHLRRPAERSLARKIAEIVATVGYIAKSGRNTHQNYAYATDADVLAPVRLEMAKRNLALTPDVVKTEWSTLETQRGGKNRLCSLTVEWTLEDGDSGEKKVFKNMGEGMDTQDKATYKAMTGATKYALLKLFQIPTGDDPEKDDEGPAQQEQKPKQDSGQNEGKRTTQPQASAKTAKEPKTLKARRLDVWHRAKAAGATEETFKTWAAQCLGVAKPSQDITADDCARLEAQLERGFQLIAEPPGEEPIVLPIVRMRALMGEFKMRDTDFWKMAADVCEKAGGWTHADVEKMHAALLKGAK